MNKIQELKDRIYKHCPELKELSFGCLLKTKTDNSEYILKYIGENNNQHALKIQNTGALVFVNKIGDTTEILGHPIHLDSVRNIIPKELWGKLIEIWDTGTIDKQSKETIDWIYNNII